MGFLRHTQDLLYWQKSKSISAPEQNYFLHFALRYPVVVISNILPILGPKQYSRKNNYRNKIVPFLFQILVTDERTYTLLCVPCFYEPPCEIQLDDQIDNEKNPKCCPCPFIQNLSWFYPSLIQILSGRKLDKILMRFG